jgi:uncharacterized membrane protein YdjX (TVP38/TMEM64 family)
MVTIDTIKKAAPWVLLAVAVVLLLIFLQPLLTLFADLDVMRARIAALGVWGPLALIGLNVVQVIAAPLPSYPIVFVGGWLYGWFWGAIYANIGIVVSGLTAMMLVRTFGRPLAERFVEGGQLKRVERFLQSNSLWLWFVVMLLPTGDYPYFAAGLSRVSIRNFLLATCLARMPFTFVLTYAAERAVDLPRELTITFTVVVFVLVGIGYWQQARVSRWVERLLDKIAPQEQEKEPT